MNSFVVSDSLAHGASNSAIEMSGGGDIVYCDWESYLARTFEQTVQVFDYNLWNYTSEAHRGNDQYKISDCQEGFEVFFNKFANNIRHSLKSGDTIVILNGQEYPIEDTSFTRTGTAVSSHQWMDDLNIFDNYQYITDSSPTVTSDIDVISSYHHSVANHYSFRLNQDIIEDPTILAKSPSTSLPAGVAISEITDYHGNKIQTEGTLVILSPPVSVNKPYKLMRTLVDIGWSFHKDSRSKPGTDAQQIRPL